jgi:hypothetical protein
VPEDPVPLVPVPEEPVPDPLVPVESSTVAVMNAWQAGVDAVTVVCVVASAFVAAL